MEELFKNINLSRLNNEKIDKKYINKLFPILIFTKLKKYSLDKKEIKNQETLKLLENRGNFTTRNKKIASLEREKAQPFNYTFYLPSGNGKYLDFIKYFLTHIYKNNE